MAKTVNGTKKADKITVNSDNVIIVTGKTESRYAITKSGKNEIFGAGGKDTITISGGKKNYIYGDDKKGKVSGNDKIIISGGTSNTVYGGKGNDTITVNGGNKNTVYGGAGKDTFIFGNKGSATIKDYTARQDMLKFSGGNVTSIKLSGKKNVIFKAGNASAILTGAAKKTIRLKDKRGSYTVSNTAIKLGKDFSDSINASKYLSTVITIDGRAAVEAVDITGNAKANIIYAGKAGGTIKGGSKNDTLYGGKGEDYLYGETGDDIINGGAGDDELIGGYGNDTLNGGAGNNILYGGSGADTFVYSGAGNDVVKDYTEAKDILEFTGGKISKTAIIKKNFVYTFDNGKTLTLENVVGNAIEVNDQNGSYKILDNSTFIELDADYTGKFDMNGYTTTSSLFAENTAGGVIIVGNNLDNGLYGGSGNATLYGGNGNDTLHGGDGNDTLYGGDGNDYLYGVNGNDIFIGGKGKDYFHCGIGDIIKDYTENEDCLYGYLCLDIEKTTVKNNSVIFTVTDFNNGEQGTLTLENAAGKALKFGFYEYDETNSCSDSYTVSPTSIVLGDDYRWYMLDANAYFATITTIDARANLFVETIIGNDQDNIIYAAKADWGDSFYHSGGYTIYGGNGNDTIYGGGNHGEYWDYGGSFYGGAGNDKFWGGYGNNELYGEEGNDIFGFDKTSTGSNVINDYQVGADIIAFKDNISIIGDYVGDSNVELTLSNGGTISIEGAAGKQIAFDLNNNGNITYQTFSWLE